MRSLSFVTLAVSCLSVAAVNLDADIVNQRRQATGAPTPSAPPPPPPGPPGTISTRSGTPPPGATTSGSLPPTTGTPLPSTPATTFSFSLFATNPTAVPLTGIIVNAPTAATVPLLSTYAPGSQPTGIPNAPPLPDPARISPANYPPLDKLPPLDSPEVQQWVKEVQNSGIPIPGFAPNSPGGCPNNTAAAADPNRCWWTCGGCTRATDVTDCPTALDWGLTYDDGPAYYTPNLLAYLGEQNLKSTFFVVGSRVISFPQILQTEYMQGHQVAVHTWSHASLTTLSNEAIIAELGWTKKVIKDVLGVTPNMMRPPYGDIDDRVRAISMAMGLTPVMWTRISPTSTFDTGDFYIHSGLVSPQEVLYNWENIVANASTRSNGFIVLEHDLFQQSVEIATGYILPDATKRDRPFNIKPVITCLNKPLYDAYIETNDNKTNPPPTASGAVITLSSGAPGSVQATGKPKNAGVQHTPVGATLALGFLAAAAGSAMAILL